LNQETADENAAVAEFNDRVVQLNSELAEFQRSVLLRTAELTAIEEKLVKTGEYLNQRKSDRSSL
jgi:predicted  nucleic acid-binding Zn-ribbon protein